jgi:hypothetical protein
LSTVAHSLPLPDVPSVVAMQWLMIFHLLCFCIAWFGSQALAIAIANCSAE